MVWMWWSPNFAHFAHVHVHAGASTNTSLFNIFLQQLVAAEYRSARRPERPAAQIPFGKGNFRPWYTAKPVRSMWAPLILMVSDTWLGLLSVALG
jgi:hypothetical protein